MNKTTEILMAARDTIKDERNWTKGGFARDANNKWTDYASPDATQYCVLGSLYYACHKMGTGIPDPVAKKSENIIVSVIADDFKEKGTVTNAIIAGYNDRLSTSHQDVIDLLNESIRKSLESI